MKNTPTVICMQCGRVKAPGDTRLSHGIHEACVPAYKSWSCGRGTMPALLALVVAR